jgi:branched-chain amino acid transport system permease protein
VNTGAIGSTFLDGLVTGGYLTLIGLSTVIVFRASRVLNIAAGQYMVLGAYFLYLFEVQSHLPLGISILLALTASAAVGALTHVVIMKRVIGQPLFVAAIITLGLSMIITSAVDIVWGSGNIYLPLPIRSQVYQVKSVAITTYGVVAIAAAVLLAVIFLLFERRTKTGIQLRAAASDPLLAGFSGIPVNRLYIIGWAMGAIAATVAGVVISYSTVLNPGLSDLGLAALAPVVLAGFDNVFALLIGAAITGELESFTQLYGNANAASAVAFTVLLLVVCVRPQGILKSAPGSVRL